MKKLLLISTLFVLASCSAQPNFHNGRYYMTGDSSCRYTSQRTENTVNCFDSDKKATGYREAMTDQQLQMYRFKKQQSQTTNTNCYRTYNGGMNCTTY